MAFRLERDKTKNTPYILIDEAAGYIKMEGECFMEDIISFFKDINDWLTEYLATDFGTLTFDCEMSYFNSSTTKQLYNMFMLMDKYTTDTNKVVVNWIYDKDDETGLEYGEDFQDGIDNLTFNLVEK